MNWDTLNAKAYKQFDCQWLSAVERHENKVSERQRKRRLEKQRQVGATMAKFRQAMESANPPKSKSEAVKMLSPLLTWLLWSVFKSLTIMVIEWAWDELHKQPEQAA